MGSCRASPGDKLRITIWVEPGGGPHRQNLECFCQLEDYRLILEDWEDIRMILGEPRFRFLSQTSPNLINEPQFRTAKSPFLQLVSARKKKI